MSPFGQMKNRTFYQMSNATIGMKDRTKLNLSEGRYITYSIPAPLNIVHQREYDDHSPDFKDYGVSEWYHSGVT